MLAAANEVEALAEVALDEERPILAHAFAPGSGVERHVRGSTVAALSRSERGEE